MRIIPYNGKEVDHRCIIYSLVPLLKGSTRATNDGSNSEAQEDWWASEGPTPSRPILKPRIQVMQWTESDSSMQAKRRFTYTVDVQSCETLMLLLDIKALSCSVKFLDLTCQLWACTVLVQAAVACVVCTLLAGCGRMVQHCTFKIKTHQLYQRYVNR